MIVIEKKGAFYYYKSKPLAQGREASKAELRKNKKLADEIDKKIRDFVASGKKLPKEIGEAEN